ncbi:uncharacterized protein LOC144181463 [Stigmatopora nigra]
MEKYSKHPESIVPQDLLQENQKTDLLLYMLLLIKDASHSARNTDHNMSVNSIQWVETEHLLVLHSIGMLPNPVADDLRQGPTAKARTFFNATVYFSDILG